MIYLDAEDVNKLFPMRDAIESNKTAFKLQSMGDVEQPLRTTFIVNKNSSSQFMPAYVKGNVNRIGIKVVSTFPDNRKLEKPVVNAQVLLLDHDTGEVAAMINGSEITRIRTGATAGAATDVLAKEKCEKAALFGTGGQAKGQLEALLTVRKLQEVFVYDISPEQLTRFVNAMQEMGEKYGVVIKAATSSNEAIEDADIITTATTSPIPVFDGKLIKHGSHINGVGSYMPNKRELDENVIVNGRVFIDDFQAIKAEAGDILIPIEKGIFTFGDIIGELGDVLCGKVQGRQNDQQITVMKTVGCASLDVVAAWNIYNKAIEHGVGVSI